MEVGDAGGADLPRLAVAEFADDDYLRPRRPAGGRPQKFTNFAPYQRQMSERPGGILGTVLAIGTRPRVRLAVWKIPRGP